MEKGRLFTLSYCCFFFLSQNVFGLKNKGQTLLHKKTNDRTVNTMFFFLFFFFALANIVPLSMFGIRMKCSIKAVENYGLETPQEKTRKHEFSCLSPFMCVTCSVSFLLYHH